MLCEDANRVLAIARKLATVARCVTLLATLAEIPDWKCKPLKAGAIFRSEGEEVLGYAESDSSYP